MPEKSNNNEDVNDSISKTSQKLEKYEILSRISDLEILERKASMIGNYDDSIQYAEQIIRLSIRGDLPEHIKEQQNFLNNIAERVHKEYTIEEIHSVGNGIKKIYEILIKGEKIREAHSILNDFKNNYKDVSYFNSIPLIQELLSRDTQLWISYQSTLQELESYHDIDSQKEDFKAELEEIKNFLNRM
ncbi:MAG: hypothetical protein KGD66_00595 [Candidatus Lokiarchaeota archaeon]|nr:hypothetical protein [Candidatus Lokiarchaeota archaeon]